MSLNIPCFISFCDRKLLGRGYVEWNETLNMSARTLDFPCQLQCSFAFNIITINKLLLLAVTFVMKIWMSQEHRPVPVSVKDQEKYSTGSKETHNLIWCHWITPKRITCHLRRMPNRQKVETKCKVCNAPFLHLHSWSASQDTGRNVHQRSCICGLTVFIWG